MLQDGDICLLNNFELIDEQLRQFSAKKYYRSEHECRLCDKKFETEDHLEFHLK